jgi:ferredoxin
VDSYCAELIGYRPDEIKYLVYGRDFGAGEFYGSDTRIVELNKQDKPVHDFRSSLSRDKFLNIIDEDAACSACYSSLIYALDKLGGWTGGRACGRGAFSGKTDAGITDAGGMIHIGQGFVGKSGDGVGVGNCTRGFSRCIPGCPPKAVDIIEALRKQ